MPRYIDADKIDATDFIDCENQFDCQKIIDSQPTADVEPVVNVEWRHIKTHPESGLYMHYCSNCDYEIDGLAEKCPHCGAHMKGCADNA